jgi:hypothetical protein
MDLFKNTYYINLAHRAIRNQSIISELEKIGIEAATRIPGILHKPGVVGALLSHVKALEEGLKRGDEDYIAVFEDDAVFLEPRETLKGVNTVKDEDWDVLLLGGMNSGGRTKPYKDFSCCVQVYKCMSCVAYVVKRAYAPKLINLWRKTYEYYLTEFVDTGKIVKKFDKISIDVVWFELQQADTFVLLTPLAVTQLEGYSDCWETYINWNKNMLSIDKHPSPLEQTVCHNCKIPTKFRLVPTDAVGRIGLWSCKDCLRVNELSRDY